jgi:2-phospho-L-lactate guanylyltransferase
VHSAVVVPVKAFDSAKRRLAPAVGPEARAHLARSMAEAVIRAAAPLPVVVVCDDPEVRTWARSLGAEVRWTPGLGLDGAVEAGVAWAADEGYDRVVVAHADLPLATGLRHVAGSQGVVLVPDRRADGTNVIALPAACGFRFAYGPGSFHRLRAEAERLGLVVTVLDDGALAWDVDTPDDLVLPSGEPVADRMAALTLAAATPPAGPVPPLP